MVWDSHEPFIYLGTGRVLVKGSQTICNAQYILFGQRVIWGRSGIFPFFGIEIGVHFHRHTVTQWELYSRLLMIKLHRSVSTECMASHLALSLSAKSVSWI